MIEIEAAKASQISDVRRRQIQLKFERRDPKKSKETFAYCRESTCSDTCHFLSPKLYFYRVGR